MLFQDQIRYAIDVVLEWELPEDAIGEAVLVQAEAMAGRPWD